MNSSSFLKEPKPRTMLPGKFARSTLLAVIAFGAVLFLILVWRSASSSSSSHIASFNSHSHAEMAARISHQLMLLEDKDKEIAELKVKNEGLIGGQSGTEEAMNCREKLAASESVNLALASNIAELRVELAGLRNSSGRRDVRLEAENSELQKLVEELQAEVKKLVEGMAGSDSEAKRAGALVEAESMELKARIRKLEEKCKKEEMEGGNEMVGKQVLATENLALKEKLAEMQTAYKELMLEKVRMTQLSTRTKGGEAGTWEERVLSPKAMEAAKQAIAECKDRGGVAGGGSSGGQAEAKGSGCLATNEEMERYLNYTPRATCPDDWYFTQSLMFEKNCFCLPRRRCIAPSPPDFLEPMAFPAALFDQHALKNENVLWTLHKCKSFECLNTRSLGDCRNCFNLTLEEQRWKHEYRGTILMADVMALKKGSLRIGLDAGGGTGSFAAKMAAYNVTIVTTAMNTETVGGFVGGLPYMETIAARGLIALHVPHKARQPFFDNSLDIIHAINSIKYFPIPEFEELMFEWDRILRPGGIMWFELFYATVEEMPMYVAVLELLGYKRLFWNMTPKTDQPEKDGEHIYLNCVLEKPRRNLP